jgi:hypothetical protein
MEISRALAITGAEPQSSIFHLVTNTFLPRAGTAEILALPAFQSRRRVRIPRRPRAEKHCAAQAEYGRLAAQAYSPSDAMSQASFCLDGMKKVQRLGGEFVRQFAR